MLRAVEDMGIRGLGIAGGRYLGGHRLPELEFGGELRVGDNFGVRKEN